MTAKECAQRGAQSNAKLLVEHATRSEAEPRLSVLYTEPGVELARALKAGTARLIPLRAGDEGLSFELLRRLYEKEIAQ